MLPSSMHHKYVFMYTQGSMTGNTHSIVYGDGTFCLNHLKLPL